MKDVLAILRWAQNLRDRVSGFRAIQLLPGIGPKTAARILENLQAALPGCALLAEQPVTEGARLAWAEFAALVEHIGTGSAWPAPVEQAALWYEAQMERLFEDATTRQADIQQLARIAGTYPNQERFLTELTLDPPDATSDKSGVPLLDEDYLILSTIHSSKGREWVAVSVLNVVDGCIPSDLATGSEMEIEEERRLLYVAMTRAKDQLDLVIPQRFYVSGQSATGDRHIYANRSRFIPNRLLGHFESHVWPPAVLGSAAMNQASSPPIDLGARMRAMWR